ncbi:MAG: hypothetical protein ACF8R7_15175 [Phycisphaerales bacterium JB039]
MKRWRRTLLLADGRLCLVAVVFYTFVQFIVGCGESDKQLISGYRLFSPNSSEIAIVDQSGCVVVGSTSTARRRVERLSVYDRFIFGEVVSSVSYTSVGFFVVDTQTGAVREGLSQAECEIAIAAFGADLSDLQPTTMFTTPDPRTVVAAFVGVSTFLILLAVLIVWICRQPAAARRADRS